MAFVTLSVSALLLVIVQLFQIGPQGISDERRAIDLDASSGSIGGAEQLLIEHDLHGFHMWIILHSILHSQENGVFVGRWNPTDNPACCILFFRELRMVNDDVI